MEIETGIPMPEVKRRGRPKGSKNKPKGEPLVIKSVNSVPSPYETITSTGIVSHSKSEHKRLTAMGANVEPLEAKKLLELSLPKLTKDKEPKIPAVEYEFVPETKEEKAHTVEQMKEVTWWQKICSCTHSRTAHKTVGTGACMIKDCKCEAYG